MRARLSRHDIWLGIAAASGPMIWAVLLVASWYVTPGAHERGRAGALQLMHVAAAIVVIAGGLLALRELRRSAGDLSDTVVQRRRFVALSAVVLSVLSLVLVIGSAIPAFVLPPGAEP